MPHEIRPARRDDLPAVELIVRSAFAPWASRIGRAPAPMAADYSARIADGRAFVAVRDGIVQGVLVLIPQGYALLLDRHHRRGTAGAG